jgi:hypothetical protein
MKPRVVTPEILDGLPADHPLALRSRLDLHRIHRAMGTSGLIAKTLQRTRVIACRSATVRILEIGAGDGDLLLNVARRAHGQWPKVELTLLDRLDLIGEGTVKAYAGFGWTARSLAIDVMDWAAGEPAKAPRSDDAYRWDIIVANLFLHHFDNAGLSLLLSAIEARAICFVAYEPRRSWVANAGSHLVGIIGANSVTRTDAVLSVAAGFRGTEISALWPGQPSEWTLNEDAAGLFSHCFLAERRIAWRSGDRHAALI